LSCPKHPNTKIVTVSFCPACRGEKKSDAKTKAARENGKKNTGKKRVEMNQARSVAARFGEEL
jgi:hypothetical protein